MKALFRKSICVSAAFLCCCGAMRAEQESQQRQAEVARQATTFSQATSKQKVSGLRATMLQRQGKTKTAAQCPGTTGPLPTPTPQQFGQYYETFGANFDIAASFGDTGANGIPSAQSSIQTQALGQIQFESEHFFYDYSQCLSRRPTFSYGGTVGLRPALVMENLTSTTAALSNPNGRPMFQEAFGWTLGPRLNFATSQMSQLAVFANLGGNYLISQVTSFKQGDDTVTATPVANGVGQSAMFWETGLEWKYLNTDIATAYINKADALSPPFMVAFGFKNDGRFRQKGDLALYTDAEHRMFFRFSVGLNKIVNWNTNEVAPGKGYTFRFGVDYERSIGTSNMPTATRYYVSANIDLVKVFKPQPAEGQ